MPKFCAHLNFLFQDIPLEERFAAARECGFSAVEFPTPHVIGIERFGELARANGQTIVEFAPPNPASGPGSKGFACLPGSEAEFLASAEAGLESAKKLGCDRLHMMAGLMPEGATRAELRPTYVANMKRALERFERAGVIMMIEPISDESMPGYFMNHPEFALEILDELGSPKAMLMYDLYHADVKGLDPVAFLDAHLARMAHLQVADNPGRHEPGTGKIDFDAAFRVLEERGYDGWVGLEYRPSGDTRSSFGWMERYEQPVAVNA